MITVENSDLRRTGNSVCWEEFCKSLQEKVEYYLVSGVRTVTENKQQYQHL